MMTPMTLLTDDAHGTDDADNADDIGSDSVFMVQYSRGILRERIPDAF